MQTYKTSQVARLVGVHPNTVRLYEQYALIPRPERMDNGYRVYTDFHVEQLRLARIALGIEVLQNGIRKTVIEIIKISATGDFDIALLLAQRLVCKIETEQRRAEEAIRIAKRILAGQQDEAGEHVDEMLLRHEAAERLGVTVDALRNWEMNGLLAAKRKQNGYRIYAREDIRRLKIICALRCANYSLASILRMLSTLSRDPNANIRDAIDTPEPQEDILSVCDRLITSLSNAAGTAAAMLERLKQMKKQFS